MSGSNPVGFIITAVLYIIPAILIYFVIKLAVKHALKELKEEGVL